MSAHPTQTHNSLLAELDHLNAAQLRRLLVEQLTRQKLGLYWEADSIDRDRALNAQVVLPRVAPELCHQGADANPTEPFQNLIIEGDNFDSLRLLKATHSGKIRVIYIDPPYNTGNKDWVYNDRYVGANDRWRHSMWLEFLYRRLTLARDLLTPDGVILVSINDENRSRLELLMDEVFPGRRLGSLVWRKRRASNAAGVEHFFSSDHEHVLVYCGDEFSFAGSDKNWDKYDQWDEQEQDWWTSTQLTLGFNRTQRQNLYYPLRNPSNDVWYPCDANRVWARATEDRLKGKEVRTESMETLIARNGVSFPVEQSPVVYESVGAIRDAIAARTNPPHLATQDNLDFWVGKRIGFGKPRFKTYKKKVRTKSQPLSSWIQENGKPVDEDSDTNSIVSGLTSEGTSALREIELSADFPYPKPLSLLLGVLKQATQPNDIVLDFFAGSGTTGHAVLELNAEDGGNRKFILCSSTEAIAKEPDKNICRDVCAERMRRVMAGYADKPGLGGSFAYLQLDAVEPPDVAFEATSEHARALLALRATHCALPPSADAVQLIARDAASGVDTLLAFEVDDAVIETLATWPSQRLAVYSTRPDTVAELLGARGRNVNSYSLHDALMRGQARSKPVRASVKDGSAA